MKNNKFLKAGAIAFLVLGSIHVCATPLIISIFRLLPEETILTIAYMYVMTGIAFIIFGWIQLLLIKKDLNIETNETIFKTTALFFAVGGFGAVATMWDNPFAYLSLIACLYQIFFTFIFNKESKF